MLIEYCIIGGYLSLPKSIFIKEVLSANGRLRKLLKWKSSNKLSGENPVACESGTDGIVTIKFDSSSGVPIGESPDDTIGYLKRKYGDSIKGKLGFSMEYLTFGTIYFFGLDLDSAEAKFRFI